MALQHGLSFGELLPTKKIPVEVNLVASQVLEVHKADHPFRGMNVPVFDLGKQPIPRLDRN
jgi:hypothetical protein